MFDEVASLIQAVGFEPDIEECERLNKDTNKSTTYRSLIFLPFALGSVSAERTLFLCRSKGASSFYKPNRSFLERFPDTQRYDVVATKLVPTRTLDSILGDPGFAMPEYFDFIKIDTQGSELDILQGGKKILCSQVVAVEVEVEFTDLYQSQPLFRHVDGFLSECGFTLVKLRRLEWVRKTLEHQPEWSAGQIVFGEALYLRDPLNPRLSWMPQNAHQAEALLLLSILYDLHDFALEMLSAPEILAMLDAENIRRFVLYRARQLRCSWSPTRLVKAWWDRKRLQNWLSWKDRFKRYNRDWGRGDSNFFTRM